MNALLAQLVEQLTLNQKVRGSIPRWRTKKESKKKILLSFVLRLKHVKNYFKYLHKTGNMLYYIYKNVVKLRKERKEN